MCMCLPRPRRTCTSSRRSRQCAAPRQRMRRTSCRRTASAARRRRRTARPPTAARPRRSRSRRCSTRRVGGRRPPRWSRSASSAPLLRGLRRPLPAPAPPTTATALRTRRPRASSSRRHRTHRPPAPWRRWAARSHSRRSPGPPTRARRPSCPPRPPRAPRRGASRRPQSRSRSGSSGWWRARPWARRPCSACCRDDDRLLPRGARRARTCPPQGAPPAPRAWETLGLDSMAVHTPCPEPFFSAPWQFQFRSRLLQPHHLL
mmetsp:Transcript_59750/g.153896  ORF Transcript_59750/g.153896 Transcript_59750/m.153896 type:complete len:261 (-) Transcript_59750:85-867(-)